MQEEMIMSREHQLGVLFTCILQFRGPRQARRFPLFLYPLSLSFASALRSGAPIAEIYSSQSMLSVFQYQDNKASACIFILFCIYIYTLLYLRADLTMFPFVHSLFFFFS